MTTVCAACGEPILSNTSIIAGGLFYHAEHVPKYPQGPEQVLRALRLIRDRAITNERRTITLGDIEWAIQEIERG